MLSTLSSLARRNQPRDDLLTAIALFRGCPERELAAIARITTPASVTAGTVLCREGEIGKEAFVIVEGQAAATLDGTEIARLGPGSFFGEMALLDGQARTATVTAVTSMTVLVMSSLEFRVLLTDAPTVVRRMLVGVSSRLRLAKRKPQART